MYRITNKTTASIRIEDLSITLERNGGCDSSYTITDVQYQSSRDLKLMLSMVAINKFNDNPPNKVVPTITLPAVHKIPEIVIPSKEVPPVHVADITTMVNAFNDMNKNIAKLVELISQRPNVIHIDNHRPQAELIQSSGPIFIPGTLVPENVESNISIKKSDADSSDFESAANALKNLRKKK